MFQIGGPLANSLVAGALASFALVHAPAADAAAETVVYSFQNNHADGVAPLAGLINVRGTLFGTTAGGGSGCGTVFSVNPATGAETVVYSFLNNLRDGCNPNAGLIDVKDTLFGTTYYGGPNGVGTVFSVNPNTGAETEVYWFRNNGTDGNCSLAGLIDVKGTLFGTTVFGGGTGCGGSGCGTVFSVNPTSGTETVLFSFDGTDGYEPSGDLIDVGGTLYGTTSTGGEGSCYSSGCGTVFSLDPNTGAEAVVYSFQNNGADGHEPDGGLINVKGTLIGTTAIGGGIGCGGAGCGSVFSVNPTTRTETVLFSFDGADGYEPFGGLINVKGALFGTTYEGGTGKCTVNNMAVGCGTVFAFDPTTGAEKVAHSFRNNGVDGYNPSAGLINVKGTLYSTTRYGGTGNCTGGYNMAIGCGTVFAIKP